MSTDELRQAAERLRGRAESAQLACGDGPWSFTGVGYTDSYGTTYTVKADKVHALEADTEELAEYVSATHPGVGLALAAWLDVTADDCGTSSLTFHGALALARLVNGSAS